jgi:hypothetical protein
MVHVSDVPLGLQAPLQPIKDPRWLFGFAVSVTVVPLANDAMQLAPQLIPAGKLDTFPGPFVVTFKV